MFLVLQHNTDTQEMIMKAADDLVLKALKCNDYGTLFKYFEEAIELARFADSKLGMTKHREEELKKQVERQRQTIDNLESTLWAKKK